MTERQFPPRRRRIIVVLLLALGLAGAAATTWMHARHVADQAPLLAQWRDLAAQRRLVEGDQLVALLRGAAAVLPPDATIMLVTPGRQPRGTEYVTFHRALYHLAPRRVWWINQAPPDGTWESRFWISAPLESDRLRDIAAAKEAGFLLFENVDVPPGLPAGAPLTPTARLVALEGFTPNTGATAATSGAVSPLGVLAAALVVVLAGAAYLNPLLARQPPLQRLERVALAWILGAGLLAAGMFWLNSFGLRLRAQLIMLSVTAVTLWFATQRGRAIRTMEPSKGRRAHEFTLPVAMTPLQFTSVGRVLLSLLIVFELAYVSTIAAGRPLVVWDSWATWAMKARTIFVEGAITPSVFADASRVVTQLDYPLLVPLTQAWFFAWALPAGGSVDDRLAGIPSALFFAALLAIFYGRAREAGAAGIAALAGTAYLASIELVSGTAAAVFADVPLSVYALTAATFGCRWIEAGQRSHLLIAGAAGGLLPWTKREGLVVLAALAVSLLFVPGDRRRKLTVVAAWLAATAVFAGGWWLTLANGGIASDVFLPVAVATLADGLVRLPRIAWLAGASLLTPSWSFFWIALPAAGIATARGAYRRTDDALVISAVVYLALMSAAFIFSNYIPYGQHVVSSFPRLAVQVTPVALLWLVLRLSAAALGPSASDHGPVAANRSHAV